MEEISELLGRLSSALERSLGEKEEEDELQARLLEFHSLLKRLTSLPDEGEPSSRGSNEGASPSSSPASSAGLVEDQAKELIALCKSGLSKAQIGSNSKTLISQLLVEIARTPSGRETMREDGDVVPSLADVLQKSPCPMETAVQVCRVLGNLSYESDEGREQILRHTSCLTNLAVLARNSHKAQDPGQRLPVILPRFLLNFTSSDRQEFALRVADIGFIDTIVQNVLATSTNDAVFNSSLGFFVCICEGPTGIKIFQEKVDITPSLTHILTHTTSPEVTEVALEVIRFQVADPDISLKLAKSGLCNIIMERVLGRWSSQEFSEHRINGCNVIINIMSHDESMKYLYALDNGSLRDTFLEWLKDDNLEIKLRVTAALAIGNFACSEENSVTLVTNGTSRLLIALLTENQNPVKDLEMQHALLGSLRNLAVNPGSREQLLSEGLLDPCIQLTGKLCIIQSFSVISKLVPVVRLLVDGNKEASLRIGKDRALLSKFVEWGSVDNTWLKSATGRLLATLVKNSASLEVMENLVGAGGIPLLTLMLVSRHQKMLNESLITLSVMAVTLPSEVVVAQFYTDLVINGVKSALIDDEHHVKMKKNALVLIDKLFRVRPEQFRPMLKDLDFLEALDHESIKDLSEVAQLRDSILNQES